MSEETLQVRSTNLNSACKFASLPMRSAQAHPRTGWSIATIRRFRVSA